RGRFSCYTPLQKGSETVRRLSAIKELENHTPSSKHKLQVFSITPRQRNDVLSHHLHSLGTRPSRVLVLRCGLQPLREAPGQNKARLHPSCHVLFQHLGRGRRPHERPGRHIYIPFQLHLRRCRCQQDGRARPIRRLSSRHCLLQLCKRHRRCSVPEVHRDLQLVQCQGRWCVPRNGPQDRWRSHSHRCWCLLPAVSTHSRNGDCLDVVRSGGDSGQVPNHHYRPIH
ncbi:hypothetical protein M427DRAFT_142265, partial [Gonapodya prolifera JEL478]